VAMEYRVHPAYGNTGSSAFQMTPVGRYGCSWEAKWIVGEAPVADDGSAAFEVPPNTPIFLQLIAANGTCLQTMRSWMTLMPGERFDCMGCHEDKNAAPLTKTPKKVDPEPLQPFYDLEQKPGSFYFPTVVQPILDQYCVKSGCHDAEHTSLNLSGEEKIWTGDLDDMDNKEAYRYWLRSYWNLSQCKYVFCDFVNGQATPLPPFSFGSSMSPLVSKLKEGHVKELPQKALDIICAWIDLGIPHSGTYSDDMKDEHKEGYLGRLALRKKLEDIEKKNIEQFIADGGYSGWKYNPCFCGVDDEDDWNSTLKCNKILPSLQFRAKFIIKERVLSLKLPSEGKIKILDLAGKEVVTKEITKETFQQKVEHRIK
ncbi:MAG: hypothetical protein N2053_13155, partial [Chitinispirillaceae bacterium]|nr:hypothetical protein [Chitinispirillaceae bacterium]